MADERRPPGPDDADVSELPGLASTPEEAASRRGLAKKRLLEQALDRGVVQLRLDARRPGVRVPEHLVAESSLALNISLRFPDTGLVINDRGVAASLRFGGSRFRCVIPWPALWGMLVPGAESLHVWPPDLPEELGGPPRDGTEAEPPPVEPMKPRLSVVGEGAPPPEPAPAPPPAVADDAPSTPEPAAAETPPETDPSPPGDKPKAPWLRLVR